MMTEEDEEPESPGPHRGIRLLAIVVAASIIGASLGTFVVPGSSLGEVLVAIPLIMLAVAGAYGIAKGEPIVGALAGLGCLLILEPLAEFIGVILVAGAFGFLLAAGLAVLETFIKERGD